MAKTCIIVLGPTAVGKTSIAVRLAQHFRTDIISADSRQCYRELNIGVAKPSAEQLAAVKHYFINSHSIHETVTAALFEQLALGWAEEIFHANDVAIMVGGTGLYIQAFAEGLDAIPPVLPSIREEITDSYKQYGIDWLQQEIKKEDPLYFEKGETRNPQRLMRALEVKRSTGNSILSYRLEHPGQRPFNIIKLGLDLPRPQLYAQVNQRVDIMMEDGLLAEALALFPFRRLNALQTVGYNELFDHIEGNTSLERAVELIKQHTRNYAKRQLTWFKKDKTVQWLNNSMPQWLDEAVHIIESSSLSN